MITTQLLEFKTAIPPVGSLLGLDVGGARIGIALCDKNRVIASARPILVRKHITHDIKALQELIEREKIVGIIAGWPLQMNGEPGEGCAMVMKLADAIQAVCPLPIFLQDERLSTKAVTHTLIEAGLNRKQRQAVDDKAAAIYILQGVLDRL